MADEEIENLAQTLNSLQWGWIKAMGMRFVSASADEVVLEWDVDQRHHQIYGIVHGGVYCGAIETATSVGAVLHARAEGKGVVGLENHTSFIRSVRSGLVHCTATPITRGRRTQLWEAAVRD
ncbi:MAG TPA: PaaI family thioesterase, partial [Candidatus Dormibacteraeota bacterium]|nr:PaaI family thioesterase [Candidatus Dormibacteraeota bacterium]